MTKYGNIQDLYFISDFQNTNNTKTTIDTYLLLNNLNFIV